MVNKNVSKDEFRHLGNKPTSKESAILMMADSLEAACRAIFMNEDADEEKIKNVINEIFEEKITDGQLNNAPITFKELDIIKNSFQESLVIGKNIVITLIPDMSQPLLRAYK